MDPWVRTGPLLAIHVTYCVEKATKMDQQFTFISQIHIHSNACFHMILTLHLIYNFFGTFCPVLCWCVVKPNKSNKQHACLMAPIDVTMHTHLWHLRIPLVTTVENCQPLSATLTIYIHGWLRQHWFRSNTAAKSSVCLIECPVSSVGMSRYFRSPSSIHRRRCQWFQNRRPCRNCQGNP